MACFVVKTTYLKRKRKESRRWGRKRGRGRGDSPPTRPDAVTIGPLQKTSAGLCSLRYNEGNIYFSSFEGLCTLWKNPTPRRAARTQCEEDAKPPPCYGDTPHEEWQRAARGTRRTSMGKRRESKEVTEKEETRVQEEVRARRRISWVGGSSASLRATATGRQLCQRWRTSLTCCAISGR